VLLEEWLQQARKVESAASKLAAVDWRAIKPKKSVEKRAKNRFKTSVEAAAPGIWNLIEAADDEERPLLIDAVVQLASPAGRAQLIAAHGAQYEDVRCGAKPEPHGEVPEAADEPHGEVPEAADVAARSRFALRPAARSPRAPRPANTSTAATATITIALLPLLL
jgi:hypothetical protein